MSGKSRPLPPGAPLSLALYNAAAPFVLVAMLPGWLLRMVRRGGYRAHFGQRFGIYAPEVLARLGEGRIWLQSVSVGETMVALALARALKDTNPRVRLVISVTTSTGFAVATPQAADWLEVIYTPLDFPPCVDRALRAIRPSALVVIEGLWPNLAARARQAGAWLGLIARMSPRSERRYRKARLLAGPAWALFDRIFVWDDADAHRWVGVGANREQIAVAGAIKFDQAGGGDRERQEQFREILAALGVREGAPVLLGGSTFSGEEAVLGRVLLRLRERWPEAFLVAVPRHAERSGEAEADLAALGLRVARRSRLLAKADVLLVDTTGELRDWYALGDAVFIGKSFGLTPQGVGGQNPAEPAALGKPVFFGPRMENFRALADLLVAAGAAVEVKNETALAGAVELLLGDAAARERMGAAGRVALEPHRGAAARIAAAVLAGIGSAR